MLYNQNAIHKTICVSDINKTRLTIKTAIEILSLPYFLGYKTDFFSFQNNPKDLDPSYKMNLDL